MNEISPVGEEREVKRVGGVTLDGAPISYVFALSAVVAVLAIIPLSVVLGGGGSFPLSQGVYPLVGWILGPIAGAVASGIGAVVGGISNVNNVRNYLVTIAGAMTGSITAGTMTTGPRHRWWTLVAALALLALTLYAGRAILWNGVDPWVIVMGTFINWSALLLFLLPTRGLVARSIGSADLKRVALGLFIGTWTAAGISHLVSATIHYSITNWPSEVWLAFAPLAPLENMARAGVGAVIGTGVIAGMRAIGLVKPEHAAY